MTPQKGGNQIIELLLANPLVPSWLKGFGALCDLDQQICGTRQICQSL